MRKIKILILAGIFLMELSYSVFAADKPLFDFKNDIYSLLGYVKDLFYSTKTSDSRESAYLNLNRVRLQLNIKHGDPWETVAVMDNEVITSDFSHNADFNIIRQKNQKDLAFLNADYISADKGHYYHRISLYRLYVNYVSDIFNITLGKQSIDWSRMRFYAPLDLFNPQSPLDIEKDERFGVDALNMEYFLSPTSSLNVIYAPYKNSDRTSYGVKFFQKIKDYDISLLAAENNKNEVLGASFDGYLFKAGVRGELMYSHADDKHDFYRAATGFDYSINKKWYILSEYFYNGGSRPSFRSQFMSSYVYSRRAMSLNKHLVGLLSSYEITPLLKIEKYFVYDCQGKSVFFNPELKYNIFTDLDLSVGAQVYSGDKEESEFGSYRNLYYFQLKWFF